VKNMIIIHNDSIQNIPIIPDNITAIYKTFWVISHKKVLDLTAYRGASSPAFAIATTISPSWHVFGLMALFSGHYGLSVAVATAIVCRILDYGLGVAVATAIVRRIVDYGLGVAVATAIVRHIVDYGLGVAVATAIVRHIATFVRGTQL
jgi:hypothetical protein